MEFPIQLKRWLYLWIVLSLVWLVFVTALGFYKYNKTHQFNEAVKEESRQFALSKRKQLGDRLWSAREDKEYVKIKKKVLIINKKQAIFIFFSLWILPVVGTFFLGWCYTSIIRCFSKRRRKLNG